MSLSGKVVFITGGASGIGKGCVIELLKNDLQKLYICDINAEVGKNAEKELNSKFAGNVVKFIQCDIVNVEQFEDVVKQCIADSGRIDIFLNNAGVYEMPKTIDVNLYGTLNGIELALKYMSKENGKNGGIIVNTISTLGFSIWSAVPRYMASKYGVVGLTRAFAVGYPKTGVKLIGMCPGVTKTPTFKETTTVDPKLLEKFKAETGSLILQESEDVAKGLIEILNNGENGSFWIVEGGDTYEIEIPDYKTLRKKK